MRNVSYGSKADIFRQESGATANVACDALQYVNALICEASPFNEGPKGLRDAHKQINSDVKGMLTFVRDTSMRQVRTLPRRERALRRRYKVLVNRRPFYSPVLSERDRLCPMATELSR